MEKKIDSKSEGKDLTAEQKQLLNRQIYAFGYEAQSKISKAKVLLIGLKGLGIEIAKNIILAGVGAVGICDNGKAEISDLGSQFFLSPKDVGSPRATACRARLAELNKYCQVSVVELKDLDSKLDGYSVVCMTETLISEQVRVNALCRQKGIKFVSGDIRGLMAALFVDCGAQHVVTDMNGEREKKGLVLSISQDSKGLVTVDKDNRHGLCDGDWVTFIEIKGMTELNNSPPRQVRVVSPFTFTIEDTTGYSAYQGIGGYFTQVKVPQRLSFKALSATLAMDYPPMVADYGRSMSLHCLYQALSVFQEQKGRLPAPDSAEDAKAVTALASAQAQTRSAEIDAKLVARLARCSGALINPMAAFLGGIMGQEVLKACSSKYTPIQQHFYFDAEQVLPEADLKLGEYKATGSRYDHQIAVLGRTLHTKLQNQTYFLIGAGAIGCEMLKNWALMGVATGQGGKVTVTDMDVIETSNLSRQFLFRAPDVQQLKSKVAARAIGAMNPAVNIEAHDRRVGEEMEHVYNDTFWEGLDGAITALDNVQARLYVDRKCVFHGKPMLDSGTLGTKGNTQCVIPHYTEMYASSRDPPEEGIPVCTLKNFPHKIEHTIAWARDKFEGRFANAPMEAMKYVTNDGYLAELARQPNTELTNIKTVLSGLVTEKPADFKECIRWARLKFQEDYHNQILQLLAVYPVDKVDAKTGARFWSGKKRPPVPLQFDIDDQACINYVVAAANLRAFNYGIEGSVDEKVFRAVLPTVEVPAFRPSTEVKIAANEEELKEMQKQSTPTADDHQEQVDKIKAQLPSRSALSAVQLVPVEFEKDDDTNFHMDFITACSNLRARNYSIKEESKHQTKFIAGKIIPAIATTTAMVTGLVCLELYKTLQPEKKLEDYRNTYANLAVCVFAFSEPFPPPVTTVQLSEEKKWDFTLWDRIDVKGPMKLSQMMEYFEAKVGVKLNTLTYGSTMLVTPFSNKKKLAKLMKKKMKKVVKKMVDDFVLPTHSLYLVFEGMGQTSAGEAVQLPTIRYQFQDSIPEKSQEKGKEKS